MGANSSLECACCRPSEATMTMRIGEDSDLVREVTGGRQQPVSLGSKDAKIWQSEASGGKLGTKEAQRVASASSKATAPAQEEDSYQSPEDDLAFLKKMQKSAKRGSVCAEPISLEEVKDFVKPVHPKTAQQEAELRRIVTENEKMQVLCGHLSASALQDVINAFYPVSVAKGADVIMQGDKGDRLYVCQNGTLDIFVARPGPDGRLRPGDRGVKVLSVGKGALFGELALMYSAPRAATVTVTSVKAELWALDGNAFKCLLVKTGENQFEKYEGWLSQVDILKPFNHHELANLADVAESSLFDEGEVIIKQGDPGDAFYIVEDGTCSAYISGMFGEKEVKKYTVGNYFGEIALLTDEPRKATVRATGEGCTVISISREAFDNILGAIKDALQKDISKYPRYADLLKK